MIVHLIHTQIGDRAWPAGGPLRGAEADDAAARLVQGEGGLRDGRRHRARQGDVHQVQRARRKGRDRRQVINGNPN